MQRPLDLNERLARIQEKLATCDELAELRTLVERRNTVARRIGRAAYAAVIAAGSLALVLVFTR